MVMLIIAIVLLFVIYYRRNIRAQQEKHNLETAHQQQLIFSNLRTLEQERKRFAEDLHDEIGASLSAIRLYITSIDQQLMDADLKEQLLQVKKAIDQSMASARRISHDILPPGLEIMGLVTVVEDFVKPIAKAANIQIQVQQEGVSVKLHFERELVLFRVLQELLNNTLKHAEATFIQIVFTVSGDSYQIQYSDNGKGFDSTESHNRGLGISNITNRVKMVGGECTWRSASGEGFQIRIEVPITQ